MGVALQGVISSHHSAIRRQIRDFECETTRQVDELRKKFELRMGTWHDGRLDCVAGNGIMSELGIGDELFGERDVAGSLPVNVRSSDKEKQGVTFAKERMTADVAVASLPIVVIKNYSTKIGSSREELLGVLAQWAATLAENQVGDHLAS